MLDRASQMGAKKKKSEYVPPSILYISPDSHQTAGSTSELFAELLFLFLYLSVKSDSFIDLIICR